MFGRYFILFGLLASLGHLSVLAQGIPPLMLWQKSFGGVSNDYLIASVELPNGDFLLGGYSDSPAGVDKTSPSFGHYDYWVIRIDSVGAKVWERSFGGSQDDFLSDIVGTDDGGALIAGTSLSGADGNKTDSGYGKRDFWVLRLNGSGDVLWQKSYGGLDSDYLQDVVKTADDGFLLCGHSFSAMDGIKTIAPQGLFDYWIVRIDSSGNVLWDAGFGGTSFDYMSQVGVTTNGGFLLAGYSSSEATGTKSVPNLGNFDYWIVMTDSNGVALSQFVYGGSKDDFPLSVVQAEDGGFFLGGSSASEMDGTKTSQNLGEDDYWIVRVNAAGQFLWDRSYGSSNQDIIRSMRRLTSQQFVVAGWSSSPVGGTKTSAPFGKSDYWVCGINESGDQLWNQVWGGQEDEVILSVVECADGNVLLAGYSLSQREGYKTVASSGLSDYWVIKIDINTAPAVESPILETVGQTKADIDSLGYRFILHGQSNRCYVAEKSLDLSNWVPILTNVLNGSQMQLADPTSPATPSGHYRANVRP